MKPGEIEFQPVIGTARYNILRGVPMSWPGGSGVYPDVVGYVERRKTPRRKQIGKPAPEFYWIVNLERGDGRTFYDEAEALAWARAVVAMS